MIILVLCFVAAASALPMPTPIIPAAPYLPDYQSFVFAYSNPALRPKFYVNPETIYGQKAKDKEHEHEGQEMMIISGFLEAPVMNSLDPSLRTVSVLRNGDVEGPAIESAAYEKPNANEEPVVEEKLASPVELDANADAALIESHSTVVEPERFIEEPGAPAEEPIVPAEEPAAAAEEPAAPAEEPAAPAEEPAAQAQEPAAPAEAPAAPAEVPIAPAEERVPESEANKKPSFNDNKVEVERPSILPSWFPWTGFSLPSLPSFSLPSWANIKLPIKIPSISNIFNPSQRVVAPLRTPYMIVRKVKS